MSDFISKDIYKCDFKNFFNKIENEWFLITAKDNEEKVNTMTAAWGGFSILWNKPMSITFVRPTRYTYDFIEQSKKYSVCFFEKQYKDKLKFCGVNTGREIDKIKETNLTTIIDEETGIPYFKEASKVFLCDVVYYNDISPKRFINNYAEKSYPEKDYHRVYYGEINKLLEKNN